MLSNYSTPAPSPAFTPSTYYSFSTHMPTLALNPNVLHAHPSTTQASGATPTQSQTQQVQTGTSSNAGLPKSSLISVLNGLLSAKSLPGFPTQIVRPIIEIGASEVDLSMRLKILSKIRDHAGNDFYQAWASNVEAMDIIREWLKAAVTSKRAEWDETVMPLLHVRSTFRTE